MSAKNYFFLTFLVLSIPTSLLVAQQGFGASGALGAYSQNFNTFAGTAGSLPSNWTNSLAYNATGVYSNAGAYNNGNGARALRDGSSSDYALGGKVSGATGTQILTFSGINNASTGEITDFTVSWDVEQYSTEGRATTVDFTFSGGGSISGTTLTTGITGSAANLANVLVTSRSVSISGLNISVGGTFSFTWTIAGGAGSGGNGHIGIDNVIITPSGTLPIELSSLKASINFNFVNISFSTATEINNSHFVIERSADARTFSEIGRVQGAGTTRVPQSYTFTDEKPLSGLNYYRLRQVDFDGAESLSGVVSVVFGKAGSITIAPSPATDRVRIQLDEALTNDGLWQVFDNMGRQVLSGEWQAESADYDLDVNTLPEGMYTFRLAVGTQVQVKQFRKL